MEVMTEKTRRPINVHIDLHARFNAYVHGRKDKQKKIAEHLFEWFLMQDKHVQAFIVNGLGDIFDETRKPTLEAIARKIIQQGEAWDAHLRSMASDVVDQSVEKIVDDSAAATASRGQDRRRARGV
jgi:hypothetical protein